MADMKASGTFKNRRAAPGRWTRKMRTGWKVTTIPPLRAAKDALRSGW